MDPSTGEGVVHRSTDGPPRRPEIGDAAGMSRSRRPRPPRRPRRSTPVATLRGGAEDFAAALPEIVGYPPTESLVLLFLGGAGRRPRQHSLSLRVDLADPEHDAVMAATVAGQGARVDPPPNAALLFVVTEDPDDLVRDLRPQPGLAPRHRPDDGPLPDLPRRALVHACVEELAAAGIATVDAVLVRAGRWWSYPDVDPRCGAGEGTPLDPGSSRLAGIAALRGDTVEVDRAAVVARAWPTAPPTRHMETACLWADSELADRLGTGGVIPAVVEECWTTVRQALAAYAPGSRRALSDDAAAAVGVALQLVPVRDRALLLIATDEDDDELRAATEALWTDLNVRLPADLAGVPAMLLGLTAWLHGSGVLATAALERSMACQPSSMAQMLQQAVYGNVPPDVLRDVLSSPEDGELGAEVA